MIEENVKHLEDDRRFKTNTAASTQRSQGHKIKDKWKLSEVLFAFSPSQQGGEGGNDITCGRTT